MLKDKKSNKRTCIVSSRKNTRAFEKRDEHSIIAKLCFGVKIKVFVYFGYENYIYKNNTLTKKR